MPPFTRWDALLGLAIFALTFALFVRAPVSYVGDSRYTLLLTQNLLIKGSFALDGYGLPAKAYQLEVTGGHTYQYFPPGSAVLSMPLILLGDWLGYSVIDGNGNYQPNREEDAHRFVASLLVAVLSVVFYATARLMLPMAWSAVIALGGGLGTQVWSTATLALWTHTWGMLLLGAAIWLALGQERGRQRAHPIAWPPC